MSLTLLTNIDNSIYISSDTRRSVEINGKQYAVADDTQKYYCKKNKIIFAAGNCEKYDELFARLSNLDDFNISEISKLCRDISPILADEKLRWLIDLAVVVATIEDDTPIVYRIFPTNNYDPIRDKLHSYFYFGAIDEPRDEVYNWLFEQSGDITDIYRDFYHKYQNNGIGGSFDLLALNSEGIFEVLRNETIPLSPKIKWVKFLDDNKVEIYKKSHGNIFATNLDNGGITTNKVANGAITPSKLDRLYASEAYVDSLVADKATIGQLNALSANIENLYAKKATINNLMSKEAVINMLQGDSGFLNIIAARYLYATSEFFVQGHRFVPRKITNSSGSFTYLVMSDTNNAG